MLVPLFKGARETETVTVPSEFLGGFNYGWPTLQMNLVFGALNQNRTDRVEVVIVTASKRACPCFGHLKGRERHMAIIRTLRETATKVIKYAATQD